MYTHMEHGTLCGELMEHQLNGETCDVIPLIEGGPDSMRTDGDGIGATRHSLIVTYDMIQFQYQCQYQYCYMYLYILHFTCFMYA